MCMRMYLISTKEHVLSLVVTCPILDAPDNGMIVCSLGDDGLPTNGDTCTYSCNPGFELNGRKRRTCSVQRRRGPWSGQEPTCTPGTCL